MKTIIRIYNRKNKKFLKNIEDYQKPEKLFKDWILQKKVKNQTIENFLISAENEYIGFFYYVTEVETKMQCGKIEVTIKNKKPKISTSVTNILLEYSCTCCLDVQSISRNIVTPEYNQSWFHYYFIDEEDYINPVSVFNKFEYGFLGTNHWQTILIKEMKNINSKRQIGLNS